MSRFRSRGEPVAYAAIVFLAGGVLNLFGAPVAEVLAVVVFCWAVGALWQIGRIDGRRLRIDPWWLSLLVGAGALWQAFAVGPEAGAALTRALEGAGAGFLVGALPLLVAQAIGLRWPFFPGDVLLFAALGWLLGPWNLFWALAVGTLAALARHVCIQRRRSRSWMRGYVALGPGMAVGGVLVLAATALGRGGVGLG